MSTERIPVAPAQARKMAALAAELEQFRRLAQEAEVRVLGAFEVLLAGAGYDATLPIRLEGVDGDDLLVVLPEPPPGGDTAGVT